MKVVLDANIHVSAMVNSQGNPSRIMSAWEQGAFDLVVSGPIIAEIGRVLRYPRIARRHKQDEEAIQRFLTLLQNEAVIGEAAEALDVVQEDESDNRYLECAIEAKAQYIVSGDQHLLAIGEYKGIMILTPAAFVTLIGGGALE
jgi:putative PIN family toxin of toxin-antitoxin system